MNLFFWKKNKVVDVFATDLASEFFSSVQPQVARAFLSSKESGNKQKPDKAVRKVEGKIHDTIREVDQFKTLHSLGVYGKARLHMMFRARLEELGYDEDVAKGVDQIVMLQTP